MRYAQLEAPAVRSGGWEWRVRRDERELSDEPYDLSRRVAVWSAKDGPTSVGGLGERMPIRAGEDRRNDDLDLRHDYINLGKGDAQSQLVHSPLNFHHNLGLASARG